METRGKNGDIIQKHEHKFRTIKRVKEMKKPSMNKRAGAKNSTGDVIFLLIR